MRLGGPVANGTPVRLLTIVAILLLLGFGGCLGGRPDLAPVFSVDQIRYWWEGEYLVVNVTLTNRANFTPGYDAADPWVRFTVREFNRTTEKAGSSYPGVIYQDVFPEVGWNLFTLYFQPYGDDPWQERWYDEKARIALERPIVYSSYGPVQFPPGANISPEIVFRPTYHYEGLAGNYAIEVYVIADYPRSIAQGRVGGDTSYKTGCFNHDTTEFYGFEKATGQTCSNWDCSGRNLSEYSKYKNGLKRTLPPCEATQWRGPHFEG